MIEFCYFEDNNYNQAVRLPQLITQHFSLITKKAKPSDNSELRITNSELNLFLFQAFQGQSSRQRLLLNILLHQ